MPVRRRRKVETSLLPAAVAKSELPGRSARSPLFAYACVHIQGLMLSVVILEGFSLLWCVRGFCCAIRTIVGLFCSVLKGSVRGWSITENSWKKAGCNCRAGFHSLGSLVWCFFFLVVPDLFCFFCCFIPTSFIKS